MEVSVVSRSKLPDRCIVSMRSGAIRRQAPVSSGRPFRFPSTDNPIKVDLFMPIGSGHFVFRPGEKRYKLEFGADAEMACELEVEHFEGGVVASAKPEVEDTKTQRLEAALGAQAYVEQHGLLEFVQGALKAVIRDKPKDPHIAIARLFMTACREPETPEPSPKGPMEPARPVGTPPKAPARKYKETEEIESQKLEQAPLLQEEATSTTTSAEQSRQTGADAEDPELAHAAVKIQAIQRGKKDRQEVQQIRREKEEELKVPLLQEIAASAAPTEQSKQTSVDVDDPELAQAALKIQAVQRGKKDRQEVQQIRREKEEEVKAPLLQEVAASAAPAEQSGQTSADSQDPELAQAAVKIQAVHRGKKDRQEVHQVRREKEEANKASSTVDKGQDDRTKQEQEAAVTSVSDSATLNRRARIVKGITEAAAACTTTNPISAAGLAMLAAAVAEHMPAGTVSPGIAPGLAAAAVGAARAGSATAASLIRITCEVAAATAQPADASLSPAVSCELARLDDEVAGEVSTELAHDMFAAFMADQNEAAEVRQV